MGTTITLGPSYHKVPGVPLYAFDGHRVIVNRGTAHSIAPWFVRPLSPRGMPLRSHKVLQVQQTDTAIREALQSALAREAGTDYTPVYIDAVDMVNMTFAYHQGERLLMRTWTTDERGVLHLDSTIYDVQRQTSFLVAQRQRTNADVFKQSPPPATRCPQCLHFMPQELDDGGLYLPCSNCGHMDPRAVQPVEGDFMAFQAPDTMARIVERQYLRANGLPLSAVPVAVQPLKVATGRTARLTFGQAHGDTLAAVVTTQQRLGRQPVSPAPLKTMETVPCERCHRSSCGCPPQPPDVGALVTQRQAERAKVMEAAAVNAGLPPVR